MISINCNVLAIMINEVVKVENLRNLIGREVDYGGCCCQVIEILEDGPALILQHKESLTNIQPDQHGEAHRKVPSIITIPVLDHDQKKYSSDFTALDLDHLL